MTKGFIVLPIQPASKFRISSRMDRRYCLSRLDKKYFELHHGRRRCSPVSQMRLCNAITGHLISGVIIRAGASSAMWHFICPVTIMVANIWTINIPPDSGGKLLKHLENVFDSAIH